MATPCPSDEALAAFLEAPLDAPSRAAIDEHVRGCAACTELVGQIAPTTAPTLAKVERYELSTIIGSGGMGDVIKAWDRTLHRWVALKLMRAADPEMERRFLLEAQAQARLSHENVCRVYEVGRLDGQAYIAMQLILGPTLLAAAPDLGLRQRVDVVAQVADALHAAHEAGLVHRDVKPSNVLVERREGRLRAFVADFGLVRDLEAPSSTAAGQILGTPQYMAPEQATGQLDLIDARTDVYALGLTLFEVLTGAAAYAGSNKWEVLNLAQRAEPPPLRVRDPSLPKDLEAVVSKCLERERARRYQSAHELAEELRRFLDGVPTLVRPVGVVGRLVRRSRRHPRTTAIVTAATAASLVLAVVATRTALQARARAEASQRLGEQVQAIEARLRYAQLLPVHDLTPVEAKVREGLADVAREMTAQGAVARGPGELALGRGALALGDPETALLHLRRAWDLGVRSLDCALALARASNELYRREWGRLGAVPDKKVRDGKRLELGRRLRDPAVQALRLAKGSQGLLPPLVEALIAQTEERNDDALRLAQQALAEDPFAYEAQLLSAEIHQLVGIQARAEGKDDEADRRFALALMQVREAAEVGRSDVRVLDAACKLGEERLLRVIDGKRGDTAALAREALPACEQAVRAGPLHAGPHLHLGGVHRLLAVDAERHSGDPTVQVERAVKSFERALELSHGDPQASFGLGLTLRVLASYQRNHGVDPVPALRRAASALEGAHRALPDHLAIRNAFASVLLDAANVDQLLGRDPTAWFDKVAPILDAALAASARSFNVFNTRAKLGNVRASWAEQRGQDPLPYLNEAMVALDAAQELKDQALVHYNKAGVFELMVERRRQRGEPLQPEADQALSHARIALGLDPQFVAAHLVEGMVLRMLAEVAEPAEQASLLSRSRALHRKVLAREAEGPAAWAELAECTLVEAQAALAAGRDLTALLKQGDDELDHALAGTGFHEDRPLIVRALLALVDAQGRSRRGRDASEPLSRASRALRQALAIHPHRAQSFAALAAVHLLRAGLLEKSGGPAGAELDEAERVAHEALRIKPDLREAQAALEQARRARSSVAGREQ